MKKFSLKEILSISLDVGERMLKCGAEVSRVEKTITIICESYGVKYREVFAMNSLIVATLRDENDSVTESRRIAYHENDLGQLERLNDLSRSICKKNVSRKIVLSKIDELSSLAPLHNPAAVTGIKAAKDVFPNAVQTAVFDTAFHQTMPKENFLYALPISWYTDLKVRRYGAHGTSHKFVSQRMNEILKRDDTKIITCHIGNGASVSAVLNGKCVNTSMGLTPNAGLIMGTRCGDIDASIIPYVMEKTNMSPKEIDNAINKESGLLALSRKSSDSRDIEDGIASGDENCILAQKMYVRRIVDYIAKYYVEMKGCDAIVFTAGIGENAIDTRRDILNELDVLGIYLDEEANNSRGKECMISTKDSKIECWVIPTDEELMIARDTMNLI